MAQVMYLFSNKPKIKSVRKQMFLRIWSNLDNNKNNQIKRHQK